MAQETGATERGWNTNSRTDNQTINAVTHPSLEYRWKTTFLEDAPVHLQNSCPYTDPSSNRVQKDHWLTEIPQRTPTKKVNLFKKFMNLFELSSQIIVLMTPHRHRYRTKRTVL